MKSYIKDLNIYNFLFTPILNVEKKWLKIYLFVYSIIIISASLLYGYLLNTKLNLHDENFNLISKNIPFNFGSTIYNLQNFNEYYTDYFGIKFYLQKTPAIPFIIYFISKISENFYFIIVSKNLFFYYIYFYISYCAIKSLNKNILFFLVISLIPIIIPYNFTVSLNIVYEDCLTAIILPLVFLSLVTNFKNKYFFLSLMLFFLYFVKTSMLFLIIILPILIIIIEKKSIRKYLPLFFSVIAISIWGLYGLVKTNEFPILNKSSSINSYVMNFALNSDFHKYYPNKSTDLIPINDKLPDNITNEWEFYNFFDQQNKKYLNENFNRYLKDIIIKVKFIFFGINRDNALPDSKGMFNNDIRISQLISKIILNLSLIILLFRFFFNYKNFFKNKMNIFYAFIIGLNLLPHLAVWASSKHLIGIINVSFIYLIFVLSDLNKKWNTKL